ncbi:unnamed protein product [Adineta steineri]|uniref:NAD(P)(+)--arginine ADP-ribosyltransferase n=2 Tax=Adineta steineri TaxID=433720 RepID=A0A815APW2_9BILA|nr:unnamed protein product [Adineta steineri]CAF4028182.1 unnamed protein product [Adineta steineri]
MAKSKKYKSHDTYLNEDTEPRYPRMFHIEFNNLKLREDSLPHTTASDHRSVNDRNSNKYRSSNTVDAEYKHVPRPLTTTTEEPTISDDMAEPVVKVRRNYPVDESEQAVWLFDKKYAPWLARAIERGCIKDRGVKKTVEKIETAKIIPNDQSEGTRLFRYYLNEAKEKNDAIFLLQAYTVECFFFRGLNKYMATGNPKKVYKKLCHKWSGYYTGLLMRNPAMKDYHYSGTTYRGMLITLEELEAYKLDAIFVNKAFQSTSKSHSTAVDFSTPIDPSKTTKKSVIIIYEIRNPTSALDIGRLSLYPEEEEVLMVPGCLFKVVPTDISKIPAGNSEMRIYIQVRQK